MPIRFDIKTKQDKLQSISAFVLLGEGDIAVASAENFAIVMQDIPSDAKAIGERLDPTEVEKAYQEMQEHSVTIAFHSEESLQVVLRMICSSYLSHLGFNLNANKEHQRQIIAEHVQGMLAGLQEEIALVCERANQ